MIWTTEKSWKTNPIHESSFLYPVNGFQNNPFRGLDYIKKEIVPFLGGGEVISNNEAVYQRHPLLQELSGSRVLVVGAGPSTTDSEYNFSDYDHIISCNHFYKVQRLRDINMFMVFLGDEVNLQDNLLVEYIQSKKETIFCFENIGRNKSELVSFKQKYQDRVMWAHTRYHSKIGAVTRIVAFLSLLQPESISIVGMDGYIPKNLQDKHFHSFQKNKNQTGTYENLNEEDKVLNKYKSQYLEFWDYILHDVGKNISYINLGHGHPCNLSTIALEEVVKGCQVEYLRDPDKRTVND